MNVNVLLSQLENIERCSLKCYSDASFANLADGYSRGGFITFLSDERGRKCPIYWQSRKIRRVVKSTLAAETSACIEGAEASVYLAKIYEEIVRCKSIPIKCFVNSKSLVETLHSTKNVDDRRLRIDIAALRNMIENKEISRVLYRLVNS